MYRSIQLYHLIESAERESTGDSTPGGRDSKSSRLVPPTPLAARVLAEEAEGLLGGDGVRGALASLVALAKDPRRGSLGARVAAAKALDCALSSQSAKSEGVSLILGGLDARGVTVETCVTALETVGHIAGDEAAEVEQLRSACATVFPMAEAFGAAEQREAVSPPA